MLKDILANTPGAPNRDMEGRQILIDDKNYFGHDFETRLDDGGIELLRPARKGEKPRAGTRFFKQRGAALRVLNLGGDNVDTSTPMGSMIFTVMAALAQMELEIKRERITDTVSKRRAASNDQNLCPASLLECSQISKQPKFERCASDQTKCRRPNTIQPNMPALSLRGGKTSTVGKPRLPTSPTLNRQVFTSAGLMRDDCDQPHDRCRLSLFSCRKITTGGTNPTGGSA